MDEHIGYVLKALQQALRAAMDEALRGRGLTTPQYAALTWLAAGGALSGAELARRSFVTPQTMNGIIVNLEAAGLVVRHADPSDARVLQADLTHSGRARLDDCQQAIDAIEEQMVSGLRIEERQWLLDALRRCVTALSATVEPGVKT